MYEYFTGAIKAVIRNERVNVTLADRDEFRLYALIPENEVTFLGLRGKMIAAKTMSDITNSSAELAESGTLMFVSKNEVTAVYSNGKPAKFDKSGELYTANVGRGKVTVVTEK